MPGPVHFFSPHIEPATDHLKAGVMTYVSFVEILFKAAEKFQDPVGIVGILEREAGWVGNRWPRIEHWKRIEFESEEFAESKSKRSVELRIITKIRE